MHTIKINVTKIDKTALFPGKNGKYLDIVLWENKDGEDQYGNAGFITQDIGKERRDAGEKGAIIGNWKQKDKPAPKPQATPGFATQQDEPEDDIPF